ncbi:SWIB domain-containing protein [Tubulinosema ratisbonensis]|uniref:SWIB domain-containing protein n=1 Tax=Tubulinosema ratisbonensis TaxID=291195 RepID=A0A437AQP2_9MICR|nr:SWIB domain-containing protein [Tubulinosema ratisbonensis]
MNEKLNLLEKQLDDTVLKHRLLIEENHCQRIKCKKRLRLFIEPSVIKTKVINDYVNNVKIHGSDLIKRIFLVEDNLIVNEFLCGENVIDDFYLADDKTHINLVMPSEKSVHENQSYVHNNQLFVHENSLTQVSNSVNQPNSPGKIKERKILIELKDLGVYKLKEKASLLFNKKADTKTNIFIELWKYVHNKKIIKNGKIYCNEELKSILGVEKINIEEVKLINFIEPLDLIHLPSETDIYDIEVELDDLVDFPILYQSKKIPQLTRKINEINEIISMVNEKISVLSEFISKGVRYIDEKCLDDNRSFFYDPCVQEKVYNLINHMN